MTSDYTCCICGKRRPAEPGSPAATVRSNVRRFAEERFALWRCGRCGSIHARDEVDLEHYYRHYPFFGQTLDGVLRWGYRRLLRRLRHNGLRLEDRIIDYGCGSGLLVQYLREKGYNATGYDPYSPDHGDPAALDDRYDCVIAQDVVEHAEDPQAILKTIDALARPGGIIAIGTPNAAGIDLAHAERYVHPLHQPYHRHIFSIAALRQAGRSLGWGLVKVYSTPYTNMPVLSLPFMHYYMKCFDGTIDVLFQRPMNSTRLWLHPKTLLMLLAGYFLCDEADIMAVFKSNDELRISE